MIDAPYATWSKEQAMLSRKSYNRHNERIARDLKEREARMLKQTQLLRQAQLTNETKKDVE
jgi:excinuclease UvrABC helicase subunit UvrB